MASRRAIEVFLTVLSLSMLLAALMLPALRTFFIEPSQSLVDKVVPYLTQFDYFYLSREWLNGTWSYKPDSFEHGNVNIYYDPSYDDSSWTKITLPFLFNATRSNSSLWVRTMFKVPDSMKGQRLRLVFYGVWMAARAWLNGIYLGDHVGYFSPFFFDIDNAVTLDGVNVLTLYLESPVQDAYDSRIYPLGIYSFSEIQRSLRTTFIGIQGDVALVGTLNPVVNLVLVDVKQYSNPASLSIRILVQNKGDVEESSIAILRIKRPGSNSTAVLEQSLNIRLSAGERKWFTWDVSIEDPEYWFTWDTGAPNVYLLNISLRCNENYAGSVETVFGIRAVEGSLSREKSYVNINGVNIFLRGGSYFSRFGSSLASREEMEGVLNLLKDANINFLRTFAHVEPKEFYELTSMKGLAVQLDFPLIGSYPALDRYPYYSELVKIQLVELLLATYNYPSIIMVCPHTLPGWLNKESPYYDTGTNVFLDHELAVLVGEVNKKVIVLPYSGEYDRYVDYGWGEGSWVEYISYKEVFPNLLSPVGLPGLASPLWSGIQNLPYEQTVQLLKKKGVDTQLASIYWMSEPSDFKVLIERSQAYQSLVLRHAIDRARILKNNVSIGVSILPLTDYLPTASGSIIDYYGVPKPSYYEVKNAFNPVHVVIWIDGDYKNNLTSLYFTAGSTARISLWLVNDGFQSQVDAVLNWRLTDLTSNKPLVSEKIELKLPSSSSPALLVMKKLFEAPFYIDGEHLLEVSTELFLKNGTKIDSNSKSFIVKPASLLKISLNPKPDYPQSFLVFTDGSYTTVKVSDEAVIAVSSNTSVTIIGPSLNEGEVYVPRIISLGTLSTGEVRNVPIALCPGAVARVLASVPSPSDLEIPSQEVRVLLINQTTLDRLILDYTASNMGILSLLNITGNTIVVPAETPLSIMVYTIMNGRKSAVSIGNETHPVVLPRNAKAYFDQPALLHVMTSLPFLNRTLEQARNLVEEARSRGFYVGLELHRLEQIEKSGRIALNTSDPIRILAYQQEAFTLSGNIINDINTIFRETSTNQVLVFLIVILLALAIGAIFIEKKEQYAAFTVFSFIILMTIAYQAFPGFTRITALELQTGIYIVIFIFIIVFLAPYFLEGLKSERGVSLIPALLIAVSYSIGNLKKRRLRTLLMLISITTMILAMTTLTSMRISLTTNALAVAKTWPADKPPVSIVSKTSGPLAPEDLNFIGAQREIVRLDYKAITPVAYSALGFIDEVPIYGVRGISMGDPSLDAIRNITYPNDALERLFNGSDTVLISKYLAESSDIDVGMVIVFRGLRLKVSGVFDGKLANGLKEPDGSDYLPQYVPPGLDSTPQPVPGDNLLITTVYTAQKLGGYVSAAYCTFENNAQVREVSKRLAALGNYFVIAMPSSESITYYFKGFSTEVFGAIILVPITITILNIAILFYTMVYERRNEIFIFSSIGLNPTHISSLFIVEAGVLGFVGGGIGYILSMLMFKIFDVTNLVIPVDVKTTSWDMASLIMAASLTAIIASAIPALKAAKIATPSLLRKWRMEEKTVKGGVWTVRIPMRISAEKVEAFASYLYERLPQSSTAMELIISEVKREEKIDENGNVSHLVSFRYGKGGNRPFNAYTTIEIRKDEEDYAVYVHTTPRSVYAPMIEANVHEVITHVRKLVLEWSALKFSVAVVVGESIEHALTIIKKYRPRLLQVYSRKEVESKLRELRRRLRSEGIWPPTIEVKKLEATDIRLLAEKLSDDIKPVDTVCLDSDDGLLSSALLIAAIQLDKNILMFDTSGKIYEVSARRFIEKSESA
ncbi:MAG: FtsX-like permease family protein [Thermoproteota archaeon]